MKSQANSQSEAENLNTARPLPEAENIGASSIKRFYKDVSYKQNEGDTEGLCILLDGKAVRTPAQNLLIVPNSVLAEYIKDEFAAQKEKIEPERMPMTRLANTVIDGVVDNFQPIIEDLLRYCSTDMVLYRADAPQELVRRENEAWNPITDWIEEKFHTRLNLAVGAMPMEQNRELSLNISAYLGQISSPFILAALHIITTISGSIFIALALKEDIISCQEAWQAAYIEEDWAQEKWGQDSETQEKKQNRFKDFEAACKLLEALKEEA